MAFPNASLLSKLGICASLTSVLLVLTGLSTTYWVTRETTGYGTVPDRMGLFQGCASSQDCVALPYLPNWMNATKVLVIFGLFLGLGCMASLILYVFLKNEVKRLQLAALVLAFAAAFFVMAGVGIYGAKRDQIFPSPYVLNWSFAMTTVGAIIFFFDGCLLAVDKIRKI